MRGFLLKFLDLGDNTSALIMNVNIEMILDLCMFRAKEIQEKCIYDEEKIRELCRKDADLFKAESLKKEELINTLYKGVIAYCKFLRIDKFKSIDYNKNISESYNKLKEYIANGQIELHSELWREKSYGIQFIRYLYILKENRNILDKVLEKSNFIFDANIYDRIIKYRKIDSIFLFDTDVFEDDFFQVSQYFLSFYHNIVICLELYLKAVAIDVLKKYKKYDLHIIISQIESCGHSYQRLLNLIIQYSNIDFTIYSYKEIKQIGKKIDIKNEKDLISILKTKNIDSYRSNRDNNVYKNIEKLLQYYSILEKLDKYAVLEQVRYGELSKTANLGVLNAEELDNLYNYLIGVFDLHKCYINHIEICKRFSFSD